MSLPLNRGHWTLDATHSTIEFSVRHLGISKVRGRFRTFTAGMSVGDDLASTRVTADVDLSSVDTSNADRDAHLRTSDFFNVDRHPRMTFASTGITEKAEGTYVVVGDLSINGRTRPTELLVDFGGTGTYPVDGSLHAGFTATGTISRKDFAIDFNVPMAAGDFVIGDRVDIELDIQLLPAA